jgi:hypothetical protein
MQISKRAVTLATGLCLLVLISAVLAHETPALWSAGGQLPAAGSVQPSDLGSPAAGYVLQPRVRAQVLVTINDRTIPLLDSAVKEFARQFPDGFTQTVFPRTVADRTTLEGAWLDKAQQKVVYDKSEMLFVDFDPAACKDCVARVAHYKDFLGRLLGETEVWVTLTPTWRLLTPTSPEWADLLKAQPGH